MIFNINNFVRVKLNDEGRKVLRENHERRFGKHLDKFPYRERVEDEEGWSKWQMWELMKEFGPYIYLGGKPMFDTDIDILVEESLQGS